MQIKRIFAFAAIYFLWGGSYLAIRLVVHTIPPMIAASARYFLAGLILLAISFGIKRRPLGSPKQIINCILSGIVMIVLGYATVFWSATRLSSWIIAVLISTSFLWTYAGECLVLRSEKMRVTTLVLLLTGLAGVPFLSRPEMHESHFVSMAAVIGVLASALAWSAGMLGLKRMQLPLCHFQRAGIQLGSAGLVLAGISCATGEWKDLPEGRLIFNTKPLMGMSYLIVGGSVVAFSAFHWLMQRESPHLVATFAYVNPIIAMMLGIGFAHERCSFTQLLAASAILMSVVLVWRCRAASSPDSRMPVGRADLCNPEPLFRTEPESAM